MGMDRDFPMTGVQAKALIVGLVVMAAFGAALFGGAIPGLKPNYSGEDVAVLDGQRYYFTIVTVGTAGPFLNYSLPQSFAFENVTFTLWLSNWDEFTGGLVHGNGSEPNGTVYSFLLGDSSPATNGTLFVSPDREFGVYWPGGPFGGVWVHLYVRV